MALSGECKLTGDVGPFVRSHIIPRAFSDKNLDKTLRVEFGQNGNRPKLARTGWYDDAIVTKKGEAILASYDSDAAAILKKHGLCWRWFPLAETVQRNGLSNDLEFEILTVPNVKSEKLRLFFLSLLWRATVSRRPEFREIRLDVRSREKLRKIVSGEVRGDLSDFPTVLLLLTTKGQPQNLTPLRQRIDMSEISAAMDLKLKDVPIFRFFLDGLIVHMGRRSLDRVLVNSWGHRAVGGSQDLIVIGRKYEGSSQKMNLEQIQDEAERDWSDDLNRIYGAL